MEVIKMKEYQHLIGKIVVAVAIIVAAKKAAIRAEDIAKGVFVPVSSLPQREPMKGVQTA